MHLELEDPWLIPKPLPVDTTSRYPGPQGHFTVIPSCRGRPLREKHQEDYMSKSSSSDRFSCSLASRSMALTSSLIPWIESFPRGRCNEGFGSKEKL